jgi:peroxiredoxin Q/BCP
MEAYRDQYAKLFHNGRKVTVIGISVDADTMQANWARESDFPIVFASDSGGVVGKEYGAYDAEHKLDNRSLFVIGPDGKVAYVTKPFKVLTPSAYTDLASAVDKVTPAPAPNATVPPQKSGS